MGRRITSSTAGVRWNRLRLRRADGRVYLDRWGFEHDRIGGVFLHKMSAPDPGEHVHDHPWDFTSWIVKGGYTEERAEVRHAQTLAGYHASDPDFFRPGMQEKRRRWSIRRLRLDEAHRITSIDGITWTIVVHGPRRRSWGFFLPGGWVHYTTYDETYRGWVHYTTYDETYRADHRDLWNEASQWREVG